MKNTAILFSVLLALIFSGCKKDNKDISLTTTVNIINVAVDVPGIKVNTTGSNIIYASTPQINYGSNALNFVPRTSTTVKIIASSDTTNFLVNKSINFQSSIYTLYMIGQAPATDIMLIEETNFPFIRQDVIQPSSDSVVNVRFVNLSPNSAPVKIKISNASVNEVDNLPYKSVSNWKAYPSKLTTTAYVFQVRDAVTDLLLASFTFNATGTNRFKNVALVIKGLQGTTTGTNAFGISPVNYF